MLKTNEQRCAKLAADQTELVKLRADNASLVLENSLLYTLRDAVEKMWRHGPWTGIECLKGGRCARTNQDIRTEESLWMTVSEALYADKLVELVAEREEQVSPVGENTHCTDSDQFDAS